MSSETLNIIRKSVSLAFGLANVVVHVASAKPSEEGNTTVCVGANGATHDPQKIQHARTCETCGVVPEYAIKRGRIVGDQVVILDDAALADAKDYKPYTHHIGLAAHPSDQVETGTVSGKNLYYLLPAPGSEAAYAAVAALIGGHPELAFMGRYAPRTATGLYRVTAQPVKGSQPVLLATQRVLSAELRAAPMLDTQADAELLALAEKVLKAGRRELVTKFDTGAYLDRSKELIARLIESSAATPVAAKTTAARQDGIAAQLEAMLVTHKRPRKPRVPRQQVTTDPVPEAAPSDAA